MKTLPRLFALLSLFALCPLAEAQPVVINESLIEPSVAAGGSGDLEGGDFSLYLDATGTVWACGDIGEGQVVDGIMYETIATPKIVMTNVQAISVGRSHSLFLKIDGSVYASGYNEEGQLGDGTDQTKYSPVLIMSGVQSISAGYSHSLFLKKDGTAWAAGANNFGQLGDSTNFDRLGPVKVMDGVKAIATDKSDEGGCSFFIKTDDTMWATGQNDDGQLGDGTSISKSSPVKVMSGVKAASSGFGYSLFFKE